ncbi:unnamed protein product, partial [Discosporangium mesarthrocarpum]
QVGKEKLEKLATVLESRYFGKCGTIAEGGVSIPFDEEAGTSQGFAFISFLEAEDAKRAVAATNGIPLDKNHRMRVCASTVCHKTKHRTGQLDA